MRFRVFVCKPCVASLLLEYCSLLRSACPYGYTDPHVNQFVNALKLTASALRGLQVVLLIDLFATYEFLLYAALVMRRLQAPVARTRVVLVAGVWLYGATRLIQVIYAVKRSTLGDLTQASMNCLTVAA